MRNTHAEPSFLLLINHPEDGKNGRNQKTAEEEMKRHCWRVVVVVCGGVNSKQN